MLTLEQVQNFRCGSYGYGMEELTTPEEQSAKKPWFKKWWVWTLAALALFLLPAFFVDVDESVTDAAPNTVQEPVEEPAPEPTKEKATETVNQEDPQPAAETKKPTPKKEAKKEPKKAAKKEAPSNDLAKRVEQSIADNFPGGVTSSSPLFAVTKYEDVSTGTVRVYVQENLTDNGRDEVARHVRNMGGYGNDDLKTIVVRDASGVDSNHFK